MQAYDVIVKMKVKHIYFSNVTLASNLSKTEDK